MMKKTATLTLFLALTGMVRANPYFAIIDAGSSGSRLYVYKVSDGPSREPVVESLAVSNSKITPGISTSLSACGAYVEPLLTRLNETLVQQGIPASGVTVALLATAGMRVESPQLQKRCYDDVTARFGVSVPGVVPGPVQTIQGRYEGALQWLTVNHLNHALSTGAKTRGVLEIGGGSYQMAFETGDRHPGTIDFISVSYAGVPHELFSRSYTGLGGNYSREDATDDPNAFPVEYPLASGATGSGHYDKGRVSVRKSIRAKPTAIPASAKKPKLSEFIGVGLFKNIATDVRLGSAYTADQLDAAARVIAMTPWPEQLAGDPDNPFLFSEVYTSQLVSEMLRTWFPPNHALEVADSIEGTPLNWTLGAALFLQSGNVLP